MKLRTSEVLATNNTTQIDEPVFAVGNALGEGVVIRDGLLTSLTPEDQDGRWKWLRYSAATSPGNSGGPLLNAAGEVVGVVIGKSPGENLNYALPIEHVLAAANEARTDLRFPLRVPVLRDSVIAKYDFTLPVATAGRGVSIAHGVPRRRRSIARSARGCSRRATAELFPRGKSDEDCWPASSAPTVRCC